jgi:hypothetical protein
MVRLWHSSRQVHPPSVFRGVYAMAVRPGGSLKRCRYSQAGHAGVELHTRLPDQPEVGGPSGGRHQPDRELGLDSGMRVGGAGARVVRPRWTGVVASNTLKRTSSRLLQEVDWTQPTAFVLGNELRGVSNTALQLADQTAIIPMAGGRASGVVRAQLLL